LGWFDLWALGKRRTNNFGHGKLHVTKSEPLSLADYADFKSPLLSNGRLFTTYVNDAVALLERETRPQ
jgi:hypothetical protein